MNWQICHPTVLYGLFNASTYILRYSFFFLLFTPDLLFYDILQKTLRYRK